MSKRGKRGERRNAKIAAYIGGDLGELIDAAAEQSEMSASTWAREAILAASAPNPQQRFYAKGREGGGAGTFRHKYNTGDIPKRDFSTNRRLEIYLTPAEKAQAICAAASKIYRPTISQWVSRTLSIAAREQLGEETVQRIRIEGIARKEESRRRLLALAKERFDAGEIDAQVYGRTRFILGG